jgi:hypothetical protein
MTGRGDFYTEFAEGAEFAEMGGRGEKPRINAHRARTGARPAGRPLLRGGWPPVSPLGFGNKKYRDSVGWYLMGGGEVGCETAAQASVVGLLIGGLRWDCCASIRRLFRSSL